MKALGVALLVLALSAGMADASVSTSSGARSRKGHVTGIVRRGPVMNICSDQTPCNVPDPGVIVQVRRSGSVVAKTVTGEHGRFSFALTKGLYTIQALGNGVKPRAINVRVSRIIHVSFLIDTGIR